MCFSSKTALFYYLLCETMLELMAYVQCNKFASDKKNKQTLNGSVTLKYNTPSRWRVTLSKEKKENVSII